MSFHSTLIENNHRWARERTAADPEYFPRLASEHKPRALFIGCSDARVPADVICRTEPGDLFVHRNIANQAMPTDNNVQAAVQYAVEALGVSDVIVCGHEECGGVRAAASSAPVPPLVDAWIAGVRTTMRLHDEELAELTDARARHVRLVELNVIEQVFNLSRMPVVQAAWAAGKPLAIHGFVYGLGNGLLRDLGVTMDGTAATARAGASAPLAPSRPVQPLREQPLQQVG